MLHHYFTAPEQTQLNRVCHFRFSDAFLASKGFSFKTYYHSELILHNHVDYIKHILLHKEQKDQTQVKTTLDRLLPFQVNKIHLSITTSRSSSQNTDIPKPIFWSQKFYYKT